MEKENITLLIAGFIALILGISLISVIASEEQKLVSLSLVGNESINIQDCRIAGSTSLNESGVNCNFTLSHNPTGWKANSGCPLSSVVFHNQSSDTMTEGTDYRIDEVRGVIEILNSTDIGGGI